MRRFLAILALLSGCAPVTGLAGAYKDQGVATYVGKPLLGTPGEFLNLAISPSGRRVAFVGRESNLAYELFVADLDGPIRKLASTGQTPAWLQWSQDEQKLFYRALDDYQPGQPGVSSDVPTGEALHGVAIADGKDQRITAVAGQSSAYPSPDLAQLALFGWTDAQHAGSWGNLIDVATGQRTPLVARPADWVRATWNPSGTWMWLYDGKTLARYDAPGWQRGQEVPLAFAGQPAWQPDGKTLRFYSVDPSFTLRVDAVREDGMLEPPNLVKVGSIDPAGFGSEYQPILPCPDGKRVLYHVRHFSRRDNNVISEDGASPTPDPAQPPDYNQTFDLETRGSHNVAPGLMPLGWLDASRLLVHTGRSSAQDKVLSVVTP